MLIGSLLFLDERGFVETWIKCFASPQKQTNKIKKTLKDSKKYGGWKSNHRSIFGYSRLWINYNISLRTYPREVIGFYGIPTLVGYLKPNPVDTYIKYIWFVNAYIIDNISNRSSAQFFLLTVERFKILLDAQLKNQAVLFLAIQFSISQQSWIVQGMVKYH